MRDSYEREIDYLRISLTDRCQLRCQYCVPEAGVKSLPKNQLLTLQQLKEMVEVFAKLGVKKLKLTGGEPLLRRDLVAIVRALKTIAGIEEITLTTNGIKLATIIDELVEAGLDGVTISLDTLDPIRYALLTGSNQLEAVLIGLKRASQLTKVKVNCVAIKELNGDEILNIAQLAKNQAIHVRFIEWMPLGGKTGFTSVSEVEIRKLLGMTKPIKGRLGNGPAHYVEVEGYQGKIGFISAVSQHFCSKCNRVRLTCDGFLKTCLYFNQGVNLKVENIEAEIIKALKMKPKAHGFNKQIENGRELKSMVQIGG